MLYFVVSEKSMYYRAQEVIQIVLLSTMQQITFGSISPMLGALEKT